MRQIIIAFILIQLLLSYTSWTQLPDDIPITTSLVGLEVEKLEQDYAPDRAYDKITGLKVSAEEYDKYLAHYKGIMLEAEYDKYGDIHKHFINWEQPKDFLPFTPGKIYDEGEQFPEFVFHSVDGKSIASENLLGRKVLLVFYPRVTHKGKPLLVLDRIDANVEYAKSDVVKIVIMKRDDKDTPHPIDLVGDDYVKVTDTRNFFYRYNIANSPTAYLLDEDGKVAFSFTGLYLKGLYQALQK